MGISLYYAMQASPAVVRTPLHVVYFFIVVLMSTLGLQHLARSLTWQYVELLLERAVCFYCTHITCFWWLVPTRSSFCGVEVASGTCIAFKIADFGHNSLPELYLYERRSN